MPTRTEIVKNLREYYVDTLQESHDDPTLFDEKILNFLDALEAEWKYAPHGGGNRNENKINQYK